MTAATVLFFVYNRIETTAKVFAQISSARPATLLVVADGPRADSPEDARRCEAVRDLVRHPTWDCDLQLNFASSHLGFHERISSGLAWAFSLHEELIILEDDCLPEPSFFPFCAALLERYRLDERVMMISGSNFQFGRCRGDASYYASSGVGTWGWASWRRAFRRFDPDMRAWPEADARDMLSRIWPAEEAVEYWLARFDEAYRRVVDTWDYQWAFAMWRHGGLQLASNANLISYIGCLPDTTHTTDLHAPYCNVPTSPLTFPLRHPTGLRRDVTADLFEFYRVFLHLPDHEAERRSGSAEQAAR